MELPEVLLCWNTGWCCVECSPDWFAAVGLLEEEQGLYEYPKDRNPLAVLEMEFEGVFAGLWVLD